MQACRTTLQRVFSHVQGQQQRLAQRVLQEGVWQASLLQESRQQWERQELWREIMRRNTGDVAVDTRPLEEGEAGSLIFEMIKREYQPSFRRRKRKHGFLNRVRKVGGRNTINRRRDKGRKRMSA